MMDQYEAIYAADIKAQANVECCEAAGCELVNDPGCGLGWRWRHGRRSSLDQYGRTFETRDEAAADFVRSREFDGWLKSKGVYR